MQSGFPENSVMQYTKAILVAIYSSPSATIYNNPLLFLLYNMLITAGLTVVMEYEKFA